MARDEGDEFSGERRAGGTITPPGPPKYDAFISYSRDADAALAPAIQAGLQRLAKTWNARRALDVFRDKTGLSVSPELWPSISQALDSSKWLVLLASPGSATSRWVGDEIRHWIQQNGPERIALVITRGGCVWDDQTGDFDWSQSDALHSELRGVFRSVPLYLDLRWVGEGEADLTLRNPRFRDAIADLAAPLHGKRKDEIEGEDLRQHRRTRRVTAGAIVALSILTISSVGAGAVAVMNRNEAVSQRDRAERESQEAITQRDRADRESQEAIAQRDRADREAQEAIVQRDRAELESRVSLSQALAARAESGASDLPEERLLTAIAADAIETTSASQTALLRVLLDAPRLEVLLGGHTGGVADLTTSPSGDEFVTVDGAGVVRRWDAVDGDLLLETEPIRADRAVLSVDGTTLLVVDRDDEAVWLDASDGTERSRVALAELGDLTRTCDAFRCDRPHVAGSPDATTLAAATLDGEVLFVTADGSVEAASVPSGAVTGLAWNPDDESELLVADQDGVYIWNGASGPSSGAPVYEFLETTGFVHGGTAFGRDPFGSRYFAFLQPFGISDRADAVEVIDLDQRQHRVTLTGGLTDGTLRDAFGAVAITDTGYAIVGTDPQQGGGTAVPSLYALSPDSGDRANLHRWPAPTGATTRIAVSADGRVAVGGLDETVSVFGSSALVTTTLGDIEDTVAAADLYESPVTTPLPSIDGLTAIDVASGDGHGYAAAAYFADDLLDVPTAGLGAPTPSGVVHVFLDGTDVTPPGVEAVDATSVAFRDGDLLVGTPGGMILTFALPDGDLLASRRAATGPVQHLAMSPDASQILLTTDDEVALLDASTLSRIDTVVGVVAPDRFGDAPLYSVHDLGPVRSAWTADGRLLFGWSELFATSESYPDGGNDPFGPEVEGFEPDVDDSVAEPLPGSEAPSSNAEPPRSLELSVADLGAKACVVANRSLTEAEWARLIGARTFQVVCPGEPVPDRDPPAVLERVPSGQTTDVEGSRPTVQDDPVVSDPVVDVPVVDSTSAEAGLVAYLDDDPGFDSFFAGNCDAPVRPGGEFCYGPLTVGADQAVYYIKYSLFDGFIWLYLLGPGADGWTVIDEADLEAGSVPDWATEALGG